MSGNSATLSECIVVGGEHQEWPYIPGRTAADGLLLGTSSYDKEYLLLGCPSVVVLYVFGLSFWTPTPRGMDCIVYWLSSDGPSLAINSDGEDCYCCVRRSVFRRVMVGIV